MNEQMLIIQALAAVLAVLCAIVGWLAKTRSTRDHLRAKDDVIKAREEQVTSLTLQLEAMQSLKPHQMRDQIFEAARKVEDEIEVLQSQVAEVETKRTGIERQIEARQSEISLAKMQLLDLEEKRRSVQQFASSLRELVERRPDAERVHFEPGANAIKATDAEHLEILAQVGEQQAKVASASKNVDVLERERAGLTAEIAQCNQQIGGLNERKDHLWAALEIMMASQIQDSPDPKERVRAASAGASGGAGQQRTAPAP